MSLEEPSAASLSKPSFCRSARVEEKGVPYYLCVSNDQKQQIGILRYGGKFCSRCEVSLLKEGEETAIFASKVHFEKSTEGSGTADRIYECPLCSQSDPSVIVDCSCFDWRMAPHRLNRKDVQKFKVVDTYGQSQTVEQFLRNVRNYPIQFYNRIEKQ